MSARVIVANSSPFVALERIGYLHLLPALFDKVYISLWAQDIVFDKID